MYNRTTVSPSAVFFCRNSTDQKGVGEYIQSIERKNCQTRIFYPAKVSFRIEGKIVSLTGKS